MSYPSHLFRPKRGITDFLHDYLEAEHIGQSTNMTCSKEYASCPISLYNLFQATHGDSNEIDTEDDHHYQNEKQQSELHHDDHSSTQDDEESVLHLSTSSPQVDHRDVTSRVPLKEDRQHSLNSI